MDSEHHNYSKEECLAWIKDPELDPVQKIPVYENKVKFTLLRSQCQQLLTAEDIKELNEEMLPIIYPQYADIPYQLSPLDDQQDKQINQNACQEIWSEDKLLLQLVEDQFITNLLTSEKKYLKKKLGAYKRLERPELTDQMDTTTERLKLLGKAPFNTVLIQEKRKSLIELVNEIKTLSCQSRSFVKNILCRKVWSFAICPDLVPHQLIIGHHGTGCTKVAQLFASLYHKLGLVNNCRIVDQLSSQHLDNTIYLSTSQLSRNLAYFIHQYQFLFGLVVVINDNDNNNNDPLLPMIRKEFAHTISLPDYDGEELAKLAESMIHDNKTAEINIEPDALKLIRDLIESNSNTITSIWPYQAKDVAHLVQIIIQDCLVVKTIQKQPYQKQEILQTFQKYFLNRGQYIRLDEHQIILNPIGEITPYLRKILLNNLLTREQIMTVIAQDDFIQEVIESKQRLLLKRIAKYRDLLGNQMVEQLSGQVEQFSHDLTTSQVRHDLKNMIDDINSSIIGDSRENIRRFLYSQIYLFTKISEPVFNFSIISHYCSEDKQIVELISKLCEQIGSFRINDLVIDISEPINPDSIINGLLVVEQPEVASVPVSTNKHDDLLNFIEFHVGLCGVIMSKHSFTMMDRFAHLFPNCLVLVPHTSEELSALCLSQIDKNLFTPSQIKYIRQLINTFNQNQGNGTLYNSQNCDMLNLARDLQDDLVAYSAVQESYGIPEINLTFQKFFQEKGLYIDFKTESESQGEQSQSLTSVISDIRKTRLKFFNW